MKIAKTYFENTRRDNDNVVHPHRCVHGLRLHAPSTCAEKNRRAARFNARTRPPDRNRGPNKMADSTEDPRERMFADLD